MPHQGVSQKTICDKVLNFLLASIRKRLTKRTRSPPRQNAPWVRTPVLCSGIDTRASASTTLTCGNLVVQKAWSGWGGDKQQGLFQRTNESLPLPQVLRYPVLAGLHRHRWPPSSTTKSQWRWRTARFYFWRNVDIRQC